MQREIAGPVAHPVGALELRGADRRHVDELVEQALVVATSPAFDDGLHFHVLARERLRGPDPRAPAPRC